MAGTWNGYDDWLKKAQDSGWFFSDFDLYHASQDPNYAFQTYQNKSDYYNADTPEARALANANQESLRGTKGFSGGSSGDRYDAYSGDTLSPTTNAGMYGEAMSAAFNDYRNAPGFSYDPYTPGEWGGHSDWYNETRDALQNHGPFEYDYTNDPLYSVYKKEYTREGQRASADALAQAAAMTGGVPSSYANTAAQQAGNYYASQLADKIPELRQQAYNEYNQDLSNLLAKYNAAYSGDQFDYGVWSDQEDRNRQAWADNLGLAQYGYETGMNQKMNTLDMAMQLQALDQANADRDRELAKPEMSMSQVDAYLQQGIQTPEVLAAWKYYHGSDYNGEFAALAGGGYGGGGGYKLKGDDVTLPPAGTTIDLSTDVGKKIAAIPGAISNYLSRWDDMDAETRYIGLVTSGVDTGVALRISGSGDRWQAQQALSEALSTASGGDNMIESYVRSLPAGLSDTELASYVNSNADFKNNSQRNAAIALYKEIYGGGGQEQISVLDAINGLGGGMSDEDVRAYLKSMGYENADISDGIKYYNSAYGYDVKKVSNQARILASQVPQPGAPQTQVDIWNQILQDMINSDAVSDNDKKFLLAVAEGWGNRYGLQ